MSEGGGWLTGPVGPSSREGRPTRVTVGLAHRGNELVIIVTVESAELLTPITVAISDDNAHKLRAQLAAALVEKPPVRDDPPEPPGGVPGLREYIEGRLHTDGRPIPGQDS